jgi:hypothetical protein
MVFVKKRQFFFAENWRKSQKNVIKTSVPDQSHIEGTSKPHRSHIESRRQGDQIGRIFAY